MLPQVSIPQTISLHHPALRSMAFRPIFPSRRSRNVPRWTPCPTKLSHDSASCRRSRTRSTLLLWHHLFSVTHQQILPLSHYPPTRLVDSRQTWTTFRQCRRRSPVDLRQGGRPPVSVTRITTSRRAAFLTRRRAGSRLTLLPQTRFQPPQLSLWRRQRTRNLGRS